MSPAAIAARLDTVRQLHRLAQYLTSFRPAEPEPAAEPELAPPPLRPRTDS